jgi:eukaryotic-like serine/threonine-protein kinase
MTTPLHPDQLEVGHHVGPWRIVGSLGAGGFGRVFKVERGGHVYALKLALRPAGQQAADEEDVNGRLGREVAALLACAPHPNLPRVHAVDRWPGPPDGYLYHVTDYVDGETFHEWRWRVKPTAAHLLTVFTEVVRVVADLHRRGVHHRDLKADNLLVRRQDERPILIDLGTARIPGASTLTVGVAPASPHLLPPECVSFLREGSWKAGANFDAGVPGDLYALGALLYEALTDGYAFDPRLPYDRLLPAIEAVVPRAPSEVNPKVPASLSDIALRLLAKRPEDRYASAELLLQALWEAAKDKRQAEWKQSLDVPAAPDAPLQERGVVSLVQLPGGAAPAPVSSAPSEGAETLEPGGAAPVSVPAPKGRRRPMALGLAGLLLALVAVWLSWPAPRADRSDPSPVSEKGSPSVTRTPSLSDAPPSAVASATDAGVTPTAAAPSSPEPEVTTSESGVSRPRSGLDAGLISKVVGAAMSACIGASCVSDAGVRRDFDTMFVECPPGSRQAMADLDLWRYDFVTWARAPLRRIDVREGPETLLFEEAIGKIPAGATLKGYVRFTPNSVRVSATEITLPDGQVFPVCLDSPVGGDSPGFGFTDFRPGKLPGTRNVQRAFALVFVARIGTFEDL